jgi:predicted dehydrogenase
MDWDLWLGNGARRPYSEILHPNKWRVWWDYGCGALGDMACHIMDPGYWALKLGDAPGFTVERVMQEGMTDVLVPIASVLKYHFPERAGLPAVDFFWYDGGQLPERPEGIPNGEKMGDGENGSILVGSQGVLTTGTYGNKTRLLPDSRMDDYTRPEETLKRVKGSHYRNWIEACKGGDAACSNFDYAGPFTEMVLMGNIALRTNSVVSYDFASGTIKDNPAASALLSTTYHEGWDLPV